MIRDPSNTDKPIKYIDCRWIKVINSLGMLNVIRHSRCYKYIQKLNVLNPKIKPFTRLTGKFYNIMLHHSTAGNFLHVKS